MSIGSPAPRIVSFVVRLHCEACDGKRLVPGGQREYGELVSCPACTGEGTVPGVVDRDELMPTLMVWRP